MSPCLSGWDRGEAKHHYMILCHEVLSRSLACISFGWVGARLIPVQGLTAIVCSLAGLGLTLFPAHGRKHRHGFVDAVQNGDTGKQPVVITRCAL